VRFTSQRKKKLEVYILTIFSSLEGGKRGTFLEFGEENRPLESKKNKIFIENRFSITTLALKSNT
jgi:hypothetical protein